MLGDKPAESLVNANMNTPPTAPNSISKEETIKEEQKVVSASPTKTEATPAETQPPAQTTTTVPTSDMPANSDITPEHLLKVIAQEWKAELERARTKYLASGGTRVKNREGRAESLVQSGHAEIEGDTMLFIYGNAIEVLGNPEFQKTVEQISFQYMRFDEIVDAATLPKLKKFQKLTKLSFANNFLHSFIQIAKLECLPHLTAINIEQNDIVNTALFRSFTIYRLPHLITLNGQPLTEAERIKSRKLFQFFDNLLSNPPFFTVFFIKINLYIETCTTKYTK